MNTNDKITLIVNALHEQFNNRTVIKGNRSGINYNINMSTEITDELIITFTKNNEKISLTIPLPYEKNGLQLINNNDVTRALCKFWDEASQTELDYLSIIYDILFNGSHYFNSSRVPGFQQIIYSLINERAGIIVNKVQKLINNVVNIFPLHETSMNSYIMNKRLMIIDPLFDKIQDPELMLKYQVAKNIKYFDRGWTSLGLADGSLASYNYILTTDIRKLSPFGISYHNAQRNLYSTLGMKGDELPKIRTQSMQSLLENGISRTGWNLFTAFVDIPDVFEDQIVVDSSMLSKSVKYDCKYQIFGNKVVEKDTTLKTNDVIGINNDGSIVKFDRICDEAIVIDTKTRNIVIGGAVEKVDVIFIEYKRRFIDAFKLTNMHGNKGVIKIVKNLGVAKDPITGLDRKIELIVGAKTIGKRGNGGQIIEALFNNIMEINGTKEVVVADNWNYDIESLLNILKNNGYNDDCTMECNTYIGNLKAVCGTVFWGCIKTPHDQLWTNIDTIATDIKGIRKAGLKVSHIEFRAFETIFGPENPITNEVISYSQGSENLHDLLSVLKAKRCELPIDKIELNIHQCKYVNQSKGTIIAGQFINGTVVDEFFMPDGFILKLPKAYQVIINDKGEIIHTGNPSQITVPGYKYYTVEKLYIPSGTLRKCWKHQCGKYGMSEIGVLVNNIVDTSSRITNGDDSEITTTIYYNIIDNYFKRIAEILSSKKGDIATNGMSVRMPFSAKAVATLSTTNPANTVEIHRDMAKLLQINNGDIVLTERFPCLGFMSIRVQKVIVTDDPLCKYTIRVSGNSLVSQNLDFDGDVLYIAAFHTNEAKDRLRREYDSPNPDCWKMIDKLNNRKGTPSIKELTIKDLNIIQKPVLDNETNTKFVSKNTGVKAQTGPVIALTYNIMRIVESTELDTGINRIHIEMFLEKTAQSVFEQKHGGVSLCEVVKDYVCKGDVDALVSEGFDKYTTELICNIIRDKAKQIGITDLIKYQQLAKEKGWSNVVNKIVQSNNKIYFASRSNLEALSLLEHIDAEANDMPSKMFKMVLKLKQSYNKAFDRTIAARILPDAYVGVCSKLFDIIDKYTTVKKQPTYLDITQNLKKVA